MTESGAGCRGAAARRRQRAPFLIGTAVLTFPALLFSVPSAAAPKLSSHLTLGGRANLRSKANIRSELLGRVQADWTFWESWTLAPFLEIRRDVEDSVWSRVEMGAELGLRPFAWLYLGQGFHQAWLVPGRDGPEWESRILFSVPIQRLTVRGEPLSLYALNEYSYNLREGEGIRNEVALGVRAPLPWERFFLRVGWRHVDAIHDGDVDQVESALELFF